MKTRRETLILIGSATTAPLIITPANASVAGFGGSTEFTQIANNIQLLGNVGNTALTAARTATSLVNQGLQIQNQLRAYANMIQNTLQLPGQLWEQIKTDIGGIFDMVSMARGISYRQANIDQAVRDRFWSVEEYKTSALNRAQFDQRFRDITTEMDNRVETSMRTLNLVSTDNQSKNDLLDQLGARLNGARGAVEVATEAAQIAQVSARTLVKISEQAAEQADLTIQYREVERDKDAARQAEEQRFVNTRPTVTPIR